MTREVGERKVDRALAGEDVVIARSGTPVVRLVPIHQSDSPRRGGQWEGKVRIADDFDELPALPGQGRPLSRLQSSRSPVNLDSVPAARRVQQAVATTSSA